MPIVEGDERSLAPSRPPPPPDLQAIVPETGEPFVRWFSRRLSTSLGFLGPREAMQAAASALTDPELTKMLGYLRSLRASGPSPSGLPGPRPVALPSGPAPLAMIGPPRPGFLAEVAGALATVGRGVGTASGAVTGTVERLLRSAGESVSTEEAAARKAIGAVIPEDIREGVKHAAAEGLEILGSSFEAVEKPIHGVAGVTGVSAVVTAQLIGTATQNLGALLDPTGTIPTARYPDIPTLGEAWRRSTSTHAGDAIAIQMGLARGSRPFKGVASTLNFLVDWETFAAPGKIAKGLALADVFPAGDLGLRNRLSRWAFDARSLPAERLVRERGKAQAEHLFYASRDGNVNRVVERFNLHPDVAADAVAAGSVTEVEDVLIAALKGKMLPTSRAEAAARLRDIDDEIRDLPPPGRTSGVEEIDDLLAGIERPLASERRAALESEAAELRLGLEADRGKLVIRELPTSTLKTELLDLMRHPALGRGSVLGRILPVLDKPWPRRMAQHLPERGIPVFNKIDGRQRIVEWGELLKLDRAEIEVFADRYLATGSTSEIKQIFDEMLRRGEAAVGDREVAREVFQMMDHPLNFTHAVDDSGKPIDWVLRVADDPERAAREYSQPLFSAQFADVLPTPDPRAVLEATLLRSKLRQFLLRAGKEKGASAVVARIGRGAALDPYIRSERRLSAFVSFVWKPSVLMRFGWPIKVVALDEQARLAANEIPSLWYRPWDNIGFRQLLGLDKKLRPAKDVLMQYGREAVSGGPRGAVLSRGNRGFGEAMQEELRLMHQSGETAYMARHGKDATKTWLKESAAGQEIAERVTPNLERMGRSVDDWLDTIEEQIRIKARTPEVKKLIANGNIKIEGVTHDLAKPIVARYLQRLGPGKVPQAVRDIRPVWQRGDAGWWRKFSGEAMEWLGSKPTNLLSRNPAFQAYYSRDLRYFHSRGIKGAVAERAAKDHAIRTTNELLYNLGNRTVFDELHKNLVPFFPAWKEVLRTWAINIPNTIGGPLLGQLSLAGRVRALNELGEALGLIVIDSQSGERSVALFGTVTPLRRLAMFGVLPGIGPGTTVVASILAKGSERVEKILRPIQQYGPETTLGPQWVNRLYMALSDGKPAPWEGMFSGDYHAAQWTLTFNRKLQERYAEIRRIGAMPEGEDKERAFDDLLDGARRATRNEFLVRVGRGIFLPAQPLKIWKSERAMNEFREALEAATPAGRRLLFDEFREEHPDLVGFLTSRSFRVKGFREQEEGREAWWRAWREGEIKIRTPDNMARVLLGYAEYDLIRTKWREALNQAGVTGSERLGKMFDVMQANITRDMAELMLREHNHEWSDAFDAAIDAGLKRRGAPMLDAAESKIVDLHRLLRLFPALLRGQEVDVDWKQLRSVTAQVGEIAREFRTFTKATDLPPGPERTYARYFEEVFQPYMAAVDGLFAEREKAKTPEDVSEVMERVRRFRNAQTPQVIEGETVPTPENVLFTMLSPDDQRIAQRRWALTRFEWLTDFQRDKIGVAPSESSRAYWNRVADERISYRRWLTEKRIASSSRQARDRKEALDSWERATAHRLGLDREYALSQAKPYQRLVAFEQVNTHNPVWFQAVRYANLIQEQMRRAELRSFNNAAGRYYTAIFSEWLDRVRTADPGFSRDLEELRSVAPRQSQRSWYDLYDFLFLSGRP